jgi:hypothetical protein
MPAGQYNVYYACSFNNSPFRVEADPRVVTTVSGANNLDITTYGCI